MSARIVVIGGGLAGAMAALTATEAGAGVTLLHDGPGATALCVGTLDVAAASPLRRGGLPLLGARAGVLSPAARLTGVALSLPAHPYARLLRRRAALEVVEAAAGLLHRHLEPSGQGVAGDLERTHWLADVHGALRASDLAVASVACGDLADATEIGLVAIPGLPGWDAGAALRMLAAELRSVGLEARATRLLSLALPGLLRAVGDSPARLAACIDTEAGLEQLTAALAPLGAEGRLLLLPPVLGLDDVARVRERLAGRVAGSVAELVGAPPFSLAGYRLDRALMRALLRAGVDVRQVRARGLRRDGERVAAVELDGEAKLVVGDAFVLATGRFVGGGLHDEGGALRERVAGLPLHDLSGRRVDGLAPNRLVRRDYEGEQPLFAAGVRSDARMRPLGSDAKPAYTNLYAAGAILGSFDPARDRTGPGVALLSGWLAGGEASRALGVDAASKPRAGAAPC